VSRRNGTPVDLMTHLLEHFTEESVLGFQQAIGKKAMTEAAEGLAYTAEYMSSRDAYYDGFVAATQQVDPTDVYYSGPYPSEIVTFE
jgi:hypothetical protein